MKAYTWLIAGAGTAAALASAAPAAAQYYDYRYNRDRDVVEQVVDGVARVAGAVAAVTQGGYYDPRYGNRYDPRYGNRGYGNGYGYNQGTERYAADACAYEAQRRYARRYGGVGVDVRSVEWYRNNRLRVHGTLEMADYNRGYGSSRYDPYGRRYDNRYDRYGYGQRIGFTCNVRPDGRVTDFDIDRYNRYGW